MICSRCLAAETGAPEATKRYLARVAEPIGLVAGFLILWLLVAGSGKLMTAIPDPVHDASIWEEFISDQ